MTPQPKAAVVDAEVILIGAATMALCGLLVSSQSMALKVTKVESGPLKVGDTPVVSVMTCFEGPLLVRSGAIVQLDKKIRAGSKIHLELDYYAMHSSMATTDKITVAKY